MLTDAMTLNLDHGRSIERLEDAPRPPLPCAEEILREMDTTCSNARDAYIAVMLVRRALELMPVERAACDPGIAH